MYEFLVLALLMRVPLHGYSLAKIINDIIGPWVRVSNGTLYPLLARLEQAKLIVSIDGEGEEAPEHVMSKVAKTNAYDRRARAFTITDYGRRRFHQLMMDTSTKQGEYEKLFHQKVAHLYLLEPEERLHLINHYINYCRTYILYYKSESEDFKHERRVTSPAPFVENVLDSMQLRIDLWQVELEWALRVRVRESTRIEQEVKQDEQPSSVEKM